MSQTRLEQIYQKNYLVELSLLNTFMGRYNLGDLDLMGGYN
jgi:hypothetical protein